MTHSTQNPCCWEQPRPITDDEWTGFGGAEKWPDGTRPLVSNHGMVKDMFALSDHNGVEVFDMGGEHPGCSSYRMAFESGLSVWAAKALMKALPTSDKALTDAGFEFNEG